ncbi:MAG: DNA helicase RecQ [Deltaproteobacteria bacterium]|nr:DNA helicase RecQ [Deltaproteobacteria bacterium]
MSESFVTDAQLGAALKSQFGFDSFRPFQREIVRDALCGRDVLALLPTGGGKSLCYQIIAALRPGLTVVVSPLIALMKDQVDGLSEMGIAATFVNSSLSPDERRKRLRGLHRGEYRMLYAAPELLTMPHFLDNLLRWNVSLFAIDEAHCISEWGHDFRPEYRRLSELRARFAGVPIMALTATATGRVRDDIVAQLRLRDARRYVASFNRPNLVYRVIPKNRPFEQLLDFVRRRPRESGIVYCQSRKTTESVARRLSECGFAALPYHAGLGAGTRAGNQERFIRDDTQIVCATIAFGMGIDKSNVRYVVHYDLPKNVEGYYQETGRAGRDGLKSDCLLLFSAGDTVKVSRFIDEITDPCEREIAKTQLRGMVAYAESHGCRRRELLAYFGEAYPSGGCTACDNCLEPRAEVDCTIQAQKFLSCVYRIREKSGFNTGIAHVVDVLTGADTEKIRRFGHHQISTHGIGRDDFARPQWLAFGRQLVAKGLVREGGAGERPVVELSGDGLAFLRRRETLRMPAPPPAPPRLRRRDAKGPALAAGGSDLFDVLRALRKRLADRRGVPPYVIFPDSALREMERLVPQSIDEFARITGVGRKKLEQFGPTFVGEINAWIEETRR